MMLWIASVSLLFIACSGNYGKLRQSKEVGQAFKNYEMHDDYKYFFSGRAARPSAIVGIDPAFELSSPFWTPIAPDDFQRMVGILSVSDFGFLSGAYLTAPDGRIAGVWYSRTSLAAIKFEGNQVTIKITDPIFRRL
jgi:hypothetical protein